MAAYAWTPGAPGPAGRPPLYRVRLSGATLRLASGRTIEACRDGAGVVPLFLGESVFHHPNLRLCAVPAPEAWCFQTPGDAAQAARSCGWCAFTVEEAPAHGEDASAQVAVYVDPGWTT